MAEQTSGVLRRAAGGTVRLLIGQPLASSRAHEEEIGSIEGLPALSLDALTSVAYGPEAIVVVLAAGGAAALRLTLPIELVIVALLALLVASYRQVIEGYPHGGGAYAVSRANLGRSWAQVAAGALIVDYTLTVAVSIAAGVAALTSAFPPLVPLTVPLDLGFLAIVTVLNLRGLGEAARAFLLPTAVFIVGLLGIIAVGLVHPLAPHLSQPGRPLTPTRSLEPVGILLLLKAFSSGCSALTGVEAIANGVPLFRAPRVQRAKRTELLLGVILGVMLIGLAVLVLRFHIGPRSHQTVLSQIMGASVGRGWAYYVVSFAVTLTLGLAANTSFGGLPVLASLLARDHYLPHAFSIRGDRLVYNQGIWVLALMAGALLVVVGGSTNALIPMFAIGVFTGFTLAQTGMAMHWFRHRPPRWAPRAVLNATGAVMTAVATVIFVFTKFSSGAWVVVIAVPLLIFLFRSIERYYQGVGRLLGLGERPPQPSRRPTTVIVPVNNVSRLTAAALSEAESIGDEVIAVTVQFNDQPDPAEHIFEEWEHWAPGVRLVTLRSEYHSVVRPVLRFLDLIASEAGTERRLVVLIPVVLTTSWRHRLLHNQLDLALANAIRRHRQDVMVARFPVRLDADRPLSR
ncbi:MAG: APC family permease [Actinomycetota bacterium]|nr:APC family permease [Actinomycetota bacterium]